MAKPRKKRSVFHLAAKYHMIMVASQAPLNPPERSHTFALFVCERPIRQGTSSSFTGDRIISWLPQQLPIKPFGSPVTGENYSLAKTLNWALGIAKLWAWGPFEIKQELYEKVCRRTDQLASGSVKYVMIDDAFGSRPDRATNCIHAASDLGITSYFLLTGIKRGKSASFAVLRYYRSNRLLIEPLVMNQAVVSFWGLDTVDIKWLPWR